MFPRPSQLSARGPSCNPGFEVAFVPPQQPERPDFPTPAEFVVAVHHNSIRRRDVPGHPGILERFDHVYSILERPGFRDLPKPAHHANTVRGLPNENLTPDLRPEVVDVDAHPTNLVIDGCRGES